MNTPKPLDTQEYSPKEASNYQNAELSEIPVASEPANNELVPEGVSDAGLEEGENQIMEESKVTEKKKIPLVMIIIILLVAVLVGFLVLTWLGLGSDKSLNDDGVVQGVDVDYTFEIDGTIWLAGNLNISAHEQGESWCYDEKEENCSQYGRLYDLEAALVVCPEGWRLPSYEDWEKLEEKLEEIESSFLRDVRGGHSFSGYFYEIDNGGYWWSSTVDANGIAKIKIIDDEGLKSNAFSPGHGLSVRCIRN